MAVLRNTLVMMLVLLSAKVQSDKCPDQCNCTLGVSLNSPQIVTFDIGDSVTLSCNRTRGDYRDEFEIYGPGYTIPQLVRAVAPHLSPTFAKMIDESGCHTTFSMTLHNLQSSENHVNIVCKSDFRVPASRAFLLIQNQPCPSLTTDTPTTNPTTDTPTTEPTTATPTTEQTTSTPTTVQSTDTPTTDPPTDTPTTDPPTDTPTTTQQTTTVPTTNTPTTDPQTDAAMTDQQTTTDPSLNASNIECQPAGVVMYYILGVVSGIVFMALLGLFVKFCCKCRNSDAHRGKGENGLTATNPIVLESNGNGALTNGNTLTISIKPID